MTAKTRMTTGLRDDLTAFARKNACPELRAGVENAHKMADEALLAALSGEYPNRDLNVLKRYNMTSEICRVIAHFSDGTATEHRFLPPTTARVAGRSVHSIQIHLAAAAEAEKTVRAFQRAEEKLADALKAILPDFQALIIGARYAEEVAAAWPGAEAVIRAHLERRGKNLPVTLTDDALKRIRKTNITATEGNSA